MTDELSEIPADCVMFNLRRAARLVARRYEDILKPTGLKSGQFSLLVALNQRPKTPLGALANGLGMERTTLTRNLQPLLRRGLVNSDVAPNDARVKMLSLTPDGKSLLQSALPLWKQAQATSFDRLPQDKWPETRRNLEALSS
jgi:DNA-binding MarR family transcriptional regulator